MPSNLTCAGTEAGVISQQPLLLEHTLQIDSERLSVLLLLLLFLRHLPSASPTGPPAPLRAPLPVGGVRQGLLNLLLSHLIGAVGWSCRPTDTQSLEKGDHVAAFRERRAKGHCKPKKKTAASKFVHKQFMYSS